MMGIETSRLCFRQWQKSDFPLIVEFFSLESNARYVGGVKPAEECWRVMATYIGHFVLNGYSYLPIVVKESKQVIGTMGLWKSEPWPEPELAYWLFPAWQRKGFATEMGHAVRDYAINTLKFTSLVSYIDTTNEPSKKLAQRLGATYDTTIELFDFGPHEVHRYL